MSDVVVLIDREQGGRARLASQGLQLHSAFTLSYILDTLLRHGLVTDDVASKVKAFIAANQTDQPGGIPAAAAPPPAPKRCALLLLPANGHCWGRACTCLHARACPTGLPMAP